MRATLNPHVNRYVRTEIDAVGRYPHGLLTSADGRAVAAGTHPLPLDAAAADGHPADLPTFVSSAHIAANQAALRPWLDPARTASDPRTWLSSLIGVEVTATPGQLRLTFPGEDPRPARLLAVLTADPELSLVWPLEPRNEKPIASRVGRSLRLLSTACPPLAAGLGALLAEIVVVGKRGTGACSSSAAVGALFLSPRAAWPPSKYAEILVHEFVHQALFLEECVNGMFVPSADFDAPESLVVSAVRKVPRGYDKSFHAAWVAYLQRRLYQRLGIADPKPPGELSQTLQGLHSRRHLLTANGQAILAQLRALDAEWPPA